MVDAHTPEWHITRGGGNAGFNWHIGDAKTAVFAMVSTEDRACLIAATPELLAALKDFADQFPGEDGLARAMTYGLDAILIGARAAIAKATGQGGAI